MGDKIFKVIPRWERRKFERGFTLIELLATLVIISVVAAVLVPRYIEAETSSKYRALDVGVTEMNGRETLTWAMVKISKTGYQNDDQVWIQLLAYPGIELGPEYDWSLDRPTKDKKNGKLRFKRDISVAIDRSPSSTITPAMWKK